MKEIRLYHGHGSIQRWLRLLGVISRGMKDVFYDSKKMRTIDDISTSSIVSQWRCMAY